MEIIEIVQTTSVFTQLVRLASAFVWV